MSKANKLESTPPGQSYMRLRSDWLVEPTSVPEQRTERDLEEPAATVRSLDRPELPDHVLATLERQSSLLLEASTRNAAGLQALERAFRYASKGLGAAKLAHEQLALQVQGLLELVEALRFERDSLQELMSAYIEEQQKLNDAARLDRERLIEEQDRFIQLLLDEHEQALSVVERKHADENDDSEAHALRA